MSFRSAALARSPPGFRHEAGLRAWGELLLESGDTEVNLTDVGLMSMTGATRGYKVPRRGSRTLVNLACVVEFRQPRSHPPTSVYLGRAWATPSIADFDEICPGVILAVVRMV